MKGSMKADKSGPGTIGDFAINIFLWPIALILTIFGFKLYKKITKRLNK